MGSAVCAHGDHDTPHAPCTVATGASGICLCWLDIPAGCWQPSWHSLWSALLASQRCGMGRWPRACRDVTLSRFPSAVLQDADTGAIMQCIVDRLHQWQTAGSPGDDSSSVASDGGSGGGGSVAGHSGGDDATDSDPAFEARLCTALQAAIYITRKDAWCSFRGCHAPCTPVPTHVDLAVRQPSA